MTKSQIDFLDDPEVDRLSNALIDAMSAAAKRLGLSKVKSFAVIALTDETGGVLHQGCACEACQLGMIQVFAEAHGAKAELKIVKGTPPSGKRREVH